MLNEIIKGVSMALYAAFGAGYRVYQNDVEQGLEEPCFLISALRPERSPLLGRRSLMREPLDIHYFPASPGSNAEMIAVGETMLNVLQVITLPDGAPIRGSAMSYEIVDDVLHVFVNYDHIMIQTAERSPMETLTLTTGMNWEGEP